ncbi:MAG: cyclic nucleotide-binding domain-containing protein [bacterium]
MELREIELFRDFSDKEIEEFSGIIKEVRLKKGEILFEENDPGDALFLIQVGAIRIFRRLDAGKGEEKSLALLEAGTYLGEMTVLEGAARSASARAETDSLLLKITGADFLSLLHQHPATALRLFLSFMKVISNRLRRTNDELVALYKVGKIISAAPPLSQLLKEILTCLIAELNVRFGAVFTLNDITSMLEITEAQGEGFDSLLCMRTGMEEGIAGLALKNRKTIRVENFSQNEEYRDVTQFGYEHENMLIVPLVRSEKIIGAILLADREDGEPFDSADVNLVQAVASQAAAAVESALFHMDSAAREEFCRVYYQF